MIMFHKAKIILPSSYMLLSIALQSSEVCFDVNDFFHFINTSAIITPATTTIAKNTAITPPAMGALDSLLKTSGGRLDIEATEGGVTLSDTEKFEKICGKNMWQNLDLIWKKI